MNAPVSTAAFQAERFDTLVMRAFAAEPSRHTRDRLIAEVRSGRHDGLLLRAAEGLDSLPEARERRAAINTIDFAFEPLVLPSLSLAQAQAYCTGVERSLRLGDASGLDRPGPLWVDTVHHACVFSVLFQFSAHLAQVRSCDRIVLLHQGARPEPRLGVVANLAARLLRVQPVSLPLRGAWFKDLAAIATPRTLIFSMADMPALAFPAASRRTPAQVDLFTAEGIHRRVDVVAGSAVLAKRLGANHLVLDYPQPDRIRLSPYDAGRPPTCPLVDWVFWPILVGAHPAGMASVTSASEIRP